MCAPSAIGTGIGLRMRNFSQGGVMVQVPHVGEELEDLFLGAGIHCWRIKICIFATGPWMRQRIRRMYNDGFPATLE